MAFLSQSRFPLLWKYFQYSIGGTWNKRKLCIEELTSAHKSVLEIGCSVGNIAPVFLRRKDISYTGIDIDPAAIAMAQRTFRNHHNFKFICADLCAYAEETTSRFDYILFAGIVHHVDDVLCADLLQAARKVLAPNGILVVSDPLQVTAADSPIMRANYRFLENGQFVRNDAQMRDLLDTSGLKLRQAKIHLMDPMPFSTPIKTARFGLYVLESHVAPG